MHFTLSIPLKDHLEARKRVIAHLAPSITVKGFRKGKAPLDKVEQQLDESSITERTVNLVFPTAFQAYLQEHNLVPLGDPNVTITSIEKDTDWEFGVEIAQKPPVELGEYQNHIRSLKSASKLWIPGEEKKDTQATANREQHANEILELLIKEVKMDIPKLLIEQEANRKLGTLVKQITDMGLTVDSYLASQNITKEQLKAQYEASVELQLRVDFILEAIANDVGLSISDPEFRESLEAMTDPRERKLAQESQTYQAAVRYSLLRHKVIDYLINL